MRPYVDKLSTSEYVERDNANRNDASTFQLTTTFALC
jgi:hypothetical protein